MRTYHLAVFPADGIGPEVIEAGQQVLRQLEQLHGDLTFETHTFGWDSTHYEQTGAIMPADGLAQLERSGFDGLLMEPVGSPRIPDYITLWGLLLPIRQGSNLYVNLRPMRQLTKVPTPLRNPDQQPIDMVCVREKSEGEYAGIGRRVHRHRPQETAVQSIVFTRVSTKWVTRFDFDYANQNSHFTRPTS